MNENGFTVFEPLFEAFVDLVQSFLLPAFSQLDESLSHLLSDLFGSLQVCHELLFVDLILCLEKGLKSIL